ncbi:unnamed protein product, partial [Porites lobata]
LCLFCQQKKSKGTTKLMNVSTFDSCKAIEEAARGRSDKSMLLKISGVDLIAPEAKYHKHCRSQNLSKSNLMFVDFRVDWEEDVYIQAFQNLREDIKPQLESGVALDMKTLLDSYQGILQHLGCNTAKSYKSERLKRRLQQSFQEEIVFQKLPDPSKPELVYSSSISLQDVINSAAKKIDVSAPTASNVADERHTLAIAQDLIYATTHGRVKTPKHIGLAISVRHMTGSKHLVTMLNRFGHCCSYDEIEVVDTSLALDIIASSENLGAVVPSNISPGVFVQVAGDNNDINEETLDGKQTTHATTLVLYQRKQQGPKPKPAVRPAHSEKRRSLNISDANPPLLEFGVCGKRPAVTFYKDKIEEEWFQSSSSLFIEKIFQDSGIEDLLIESGVYGCHTASMLLKGKSYNRGVRAHKLVLEALLRLRWQAFGAWMEAEDVELPTVYQRQCLSLINCCQRESNDVAFLKTSFGLLCDKLPQLLQIFARFCTEASQQSKLFHFWNMYVDIVLLLLRFIRAEREGSWKLHLKAVAEMVPYFFSMDRIKYSRLLIAAKCRDIDVKEVLRYELSTVPFALAHADGALRKTTKSVLMAEVERECQAQGRLPESALSTAFIFDAMALVQTLKSAGSRTFGDPAERYFNVLFTPLRQSQCRRVDVVFDRYDVQESIKESERVRRERIVIQSPDTDVAVLAIYAYQMIQCNEIWFKTGVKDKVRFVPVHRIAEKLGRSVCAAIPAFHALTGCDSTSGLFQIGKKK